MLLARSRRSTVCGHWAALSAMLGALLAALSGAAPAPATSILFLDRCAANCTYHQGGDSSINNTSSIITGTRTITPFSHDAAFWAENLACVQAAYAPYDIVVTDVDPGNVAHFEVPVAGVPADIGQPPGVAGVSPFTCGLIPNGVAFAFANAHTNAKELCWTTTQETAHLFGLDHEALARDPMTYISGCLEKRFTPEDAPCGELVPRTCACVGTTQNSDAMIASVLGRAPAGAPLFLNGFSVSQDGLDEIGSNCQWTTAVGEGPVMFLESGDPAVRELSCGTASRLQELSRQRDAARPR